MKLIYNIRIITHLQQMTNNLIMDRHNKEECLKQYTLSSSQPSKCWWQSLESKNFHQLLYLIL